MKKCIAIILSLVLCCTMAACGTNPAPTTTQPATTAAPTTVAPTTVPPTTVPPTTVPPTTTVPVETFERKSLKLGSQMPDFTVVDSQGNTHTLYELLEENKMVLLNFWFIDCPYCVMEFPYLQNTYEQYQDSTVVLALTPYDELEDIETFRQTNELTFAMCEDNQRLDAAFGVTGYPTTVVIDRYGVVCLIHVGAVTQEVIFSKIFSHFTADDYESKPLRSYMQIK